MVIPFSADGTRKMMIPVACINWPEFGYNPKVECGLYHDGCNLCAEFTVAECHIRATETVDGKHVNQDSCVELFIECADGGHYINFEANPLGTLLAARRLNRAEKERLDNDELVSVIRGGTYVSSPRRPFELADGGFWALTLKIPFALLGFNALPEEIRLNIYKCGDACRERHYLSAFPIASERPDFHRPDFFQTIGIEKICKN